MTLVQPVTRKELLKITNQLRDIVFYVDECRDISVSQLKQMDDMIYTLFTTFDFKPQKDDEGNPKHAQVVPMQTISKQSLEMALKIAQNFGLTPSSRSKISAPQKLEIKDNEFNFFND